MNKPKQLAFLTDQQWNNLSLWLDRNGINVSQIYRSESWSRPGNCHILVLYIKDTPTFWSEHDDIALFLLVDDFDASRLYLHRHPSDSNGNLKYGVISHRISSGNLIVTLMGQRHAYEVPISLRQ